MKVTLITGASGGIGEAISRKIAAQQENVLLIARNREKLEALARELEDRFRVKAFTIVADLAQPNAPSFIYQECSRQSLEVVTLVNNAGMGSGGEFAAQDLSSQLAMMQLNMTSLVAITHLFLQDMKTRRSGTIVNIGSMISFMPVPFMAVYGATKAFVRSFTHALYEEAKPFGVSCLLFSPGLTDSNFMTAAGLQNHSGQALTAGAPVQTPVQVADEFMRAYNGRKRSVISGRTNRMARRLVSVIPDRLIASQSSSAYLKKMKKSSQIK